MAELTRAEVVLGANDAQLQSTLAKAQSSMQAVGQKMQRVGRTMSLTVTAPLAAIGAASVKMASDAEEAANKFDVVMGDSAASARAELRQLNETIPLTTAQMEGMSAGLQDLLVPMGVARDEAADMSVGMVELAGDLGSFNNEDPSRVLEAMKSALAGASEPMRRYGVDTRVAALESIALKEGLIEAGEEMDSAAQAQAVMLAIQQDSTDAMGDAARTADSTANQMKFLKRDLKELAISIGNELIPIARELMEALSGVLRFFQDMSPTAKRVSLVLAGVVAAIGPLLLVVGTAITVIPTLTAAVSGLGVALGVLSGPIGIAVAAVAGLGLAWLKWGDQIKAAMAPLVERVKAGFRVITENVLKPIFGLLKSLGKAWLSWVELLGALAIRVGEAVLKMTAPFREVLGPVVRSVFNGIKTIVSTTVDFIREQMIGRFGAIVNGIKSKVDAVRGFFEGLKNDLVGNSIIPDIMQRITDEFGRLPKVMVEPAAKAAGNVAKAASNMSQIGNNAFESLGRSAIQSMGEMSRSVTQIAKDMVGNLLQTLGKIAGTALLGPLGGLLGGKIGGFLGGLFAKGGFLPAGQVGIVGEEGPEIIRSTAGGTQIEPIDTTAAAGMGGGGGGASRSESGVGAQELVLRPDLSGLPDPPRTMSPDAVAVDSYWREVFSRLAIDARDRGSL